MVDVRPLGRYEERLHHDRHIREHEHREREHIGDLLPRRAVDAAPLRRGRDRAEDEEREIKIHHRLQCRYGKHVPLMVMEHVDRRRAEIYHDAQPREHRRGHDAHRHIVAGEAAAEHAGEELSAVFAEHLQIPARPAQTLRPGLPEADGLLIVEHGLRAVADAPSRRHVFDGELDVLGQQVERPAAALPFEHGARKEKARAGNAAARPDAGSRAVQIARFAEEPETVARGDPVVAVVFRVTVAGDDVLALGKRLVHAGDEIALEHVVGVEDDVAVKLVVRMALHFAQEEVERIALAAERSVVPLIHLRAVGARRFRRFIAAVVGHDENLEKAFGVALRLDAVKKIADDGLLVARGDEDRKAVQRRFPRPPLPRQPRNGYVQKLIHIAGKKQAHQNEVYHFHGLHGAFSFPCDAKDITHRRAKSIKGSLRFV